MNEKQVEKSKSSLGEDAVEMLQQAHRDALWILENLGVGCQQPEIHRVFQQFEADGLAVVYEGRVFVTSDLVEQCLQRAPGVSDFFVPRNSFFIGGTAPYVYDDDKGEGGRTPTAALVEQIAQIAQRHGIVAGMGRGIKLNNEVEQMNIMAQNCSKPIYFAVTSDAALEQAKELY
ncbi:MAG: trimethylamine--corrinoid methyltransferase, partial [Deltaproteobacteria bacterium]